jgi:PAS domain S-box-containing protein
MSYSLSETDVTGRSFRGRNPHVADIYKDDASTIREAARVTGRSDPFSSAICATWVPTVITDPREHDNPIVFANAAFAKLTGFEREETLGRNCRFLQGPATSRKDVARLQVAIDARERIELDLLNHKKDGTAFWNRTLVSPVIEDHEDTAYLLVWQFGTTSEQPCPASCTRGRDNREITTACRDVEPRTSDSHLPFALSASQLGSWTLDPFTNEYQTCDRSKEIFGHPAVGPVTYEQLAATIHPDDRDRAAKAFKGAIDQEDQIEVDLRVLTPGGGERCVHISGGRDRSGKSTTPLLAGIVQDITSRRRAEEHRALLADELNHRVKNTLMSLQAVVSQTMRHATSVEEAAITLGARIQAMAAANDLLVNEHFESASIFDLFDRTLAPFGVEDGCRFSFKGPDLRLPPRLVVSFALALHELATNATKYGALSNAAGMVQISWMVVTDPDASRLHLVWTEKHGPRVERPTKTSFGTLLLQRVLEREIGGTAEISFLPEGVSFKAIAPLYGKGVSADRI